MFELDLNAREKQLLINALILTGANTMNGSPVQAEYAALAQRIVTLEKS